MLGGARCCKWLAGSGQSAGHFSPAGPWVTERQSGKWGQAINSKGCDGRQSAGRLSRDGTSFCVRLVKFNLQNSTLPPPTLGFVCCCTSSLQTSKWRFTTDGQISIRKRKDNSQPHEERGTTDPAPGWCLECAPSRCADWVVCFRHGCNSHPLQVVDGRAPSKISAAAKVWQLWMERPIPTWA